jgi:hypothetical protein
MLIFSLLQFSKCPSTFAAPIATINYAQLNYYWSSYVDTKYKLCQFFILPSFHTLNFSIIFFRTSKKHKDPHILEPKRHVLSPAAIKNISNWNEIIGCKAFSQIIPQTPNYNTHFN